MFLSLWNSHFDQFLFQKLYYLDDPIHLLFTSCSFPLHSYLYFLLIAFSFLFIFIRFVSNLFLIHCLFVSFSCSFVFFIAFDLRNLPQFPKAIGFLLSTSYLKTIYFKPQFNWGIHFLFILLPSVSRVFQKVIYKGGIVNKVWGLDG